MPESERREAIDEMEISANEAEKNGRRRRRAHRYRSLQHGFSSKNKVRVIVVAALSVLLVVILWYFLVSTPLE